MRILFLLITSCGHVALPKSNVSQDMLKKLSTKKDELLTYAPWCQYSDTFRGPSKDTCTAEGTGTGDGDMTLFNGLLCYSKLEVACDAVSQACTSEQCYRSPSRVGVDNEPTFSRDMFLGIVGYTLGTKDLAPVSSLEKRMRSHRNLCSGSSEYCGLRNTTYGIIGELWRYHKKKLTQEMLLGMIADDESLLFSAYVSPIGYQLELVATTILLRQAMNSYTPHLELAALKLVERWPENIYFRYVLKRADNAMAQEILERVPSAKPAKRDSWSFQTGNEFRTMVWEWIFLINLIEVEHGR